jgi:hypothetical protein
MRGALRFANSVFIIAAVVVGTIVSTLLLFLVAGVAICRDGLRGAKLRWRWIHFYPIQPDSEDIGGAARPGPGGKEWSRLV